MSVKPTKIVVLFRLYLKKWKMSEDIEKNEIKTTRILRFEESFFSKRRSHHLVLLSALQLSGRPSLQRCSVCSFRAVSTLSASLCLYINLKDEVRHIIDRRSKHALELEICRTGHEYPLLVIA